MLRGSKTTVVLDTTVSTGGGGGDGDGGACELPHCEDGQVDGGRDQHCTDSGTGVDPDHPPLTRRELNAWYSADFANSVFYQVVIGGYLPLLLQQMALEKAGFPETCPNYATVRGNTTLSTLVFGKPVHDFFIDNARTGKAGCTSTCQDYLGSSYCEGECSATATDTMLYRVTSAFWHHACTVLRRAAVAARSVEVGSTEASLAEASCSIRVRLTPPICIVFHTLHPGTPEQSLECLSADGHSRHRLRVSIGEWSIDPTEYALLFLGFSVVVQAIVFLLFGALGDFGGLRREVYAVSTWLGSLACVFCIAVTPDLWWLGGVFMIIANVFFGISVLMYNAWLPLVCGRIIDPASPTSILQPPFFSQYSSVSISSPALPVRTSSEPVHQVHTTRSQIPKYPHTFQLDPPEYFLGGYR